MNWHQDGYNKGYNDGLEGNENKTNNRYLMDIIFPEADFEEAFWDGYEEGYENGKEGRENEEH